MFGRINYFIILYIKPHIFRYNQFNMMMIAESID